MTNKMINTKGFTRCLLKRKYFNLLFCLGITFFALLVNIFLSDEIAHSVRSGLSLCANVIIPSIFPFMILSDFIGSFCDFSSLRLSGKIFTRLFGISKAGLGSFIMGLICGFPLGVSYAVKLYRNGRICREECETLIGFCNNTGPAFLITGVGLGLRKSAVEGMILYIAMVVSAVMVGIIFRYKGEVRNDVYKETDARFSLIESIRRAASNTLNICAYLTFFSLFCGLFKKFLGITPLYLLIISCLEIGSATSILSKTAICSLLSFVLTAFSIGFSGLCVHAQAASFIKGTDIRMGKYYIMKLVQGIICAAICGILFSIAL